MKNLPRKLLSMSLLLTAANASFGFGLPTEGKQEFQPAEWVAASDEHLDNMRGGFDVGSGLSVSFGIVRTVMINGELVTKVSFTLPDLSKISAETARIVSAALAKAGIVQNGPGNFVDAGVRSPLTTGSAIGALNQNTPDAGVRSELAAESAAVTLIQNSLNDQKIQTLTVINAGVNSLGMLRAINTQTVLKDALLGSLGIR